MNKKLIRLTEQDLHRIVKESVKKVLKESENMPIKEVIQELLWACEVYDLTDELYSCLRNFEKEHGLDLDNETYQHDIPVVHHNCSFSPTAERTPKY